MKRLVGFTKEQENLYKEFLGFKFKDSIEDLEWFHHAGPWLFHKIYESFGKNLQKNSYPFGNECLAFELCTQNSSLQNGWFLLKKDGNPAFGLSIYFYKATSYPGAEGYDGFPSLSIHIGYSYNYEHQGSGFAWDYETVTQNSITPIVNTTMERIFGWVGRNTNFIYEIFIVEEIIKNLVVPLASFLEDKFGNHKSIEEFKAAMQGELLLKQGKALI